MQLKRRKSKKLLGRVRCTRRKKEEKRSAPKWMLLDEDVGEDVDVKVDLKVDVWTGEGDHRVFFARVLFFFFFCFALLCSYSPAALVRLRCGLAILTSSHLLVLSPQILHFAPAPAAACMLDVAVAKTIILRPWACMT